ncbi:MAG TPA: hypothetical protein PKL17_14660 [Pseudomonadota bacterium]|nr:hypothetical protein [Pseudomonadota bacterium]HNI61043.1 hypothetical protein [Pseudomonadota bacterium]HNK46024.1 hypothetical protein [Pseudomonadota bacterium]HNN49493.1 hypothetical protein [Pseudomonadota bacterium]
MASKPSEPQKGIGAADKAQPTGKAAPVTRATSVEGSSEVEAAKQAAPVGALSAATAVGKAVSADRVASIADRLRRGVLTPAQAVEELIEDTVRTSLPGLTASSPLRQKLREILQSYAKDDPYLFAKVRRLSGDQE